MKLRYPWTSNPVKVSGRYSNHADQEKRIREVLQLELAGPPKPKTQPRDDRKSDCRLMRWRRCSEAMSVALQ